MIAIGFLLTPSRRCCFIRIDRFIASCLVRLGRGLSEMTDATINLVSLARCTTDKAGFSCASGACLYRVGGLVTSFSNFWRVD